MKEDNQLQFVMDFIIIFAILLREEEPGSDLTCDDSQDSLTAIRHMISDIHIVATSQQQVPELGNWLLKRCGYR